MWDGEGWDREGGKGLSSSKISFQPDPGSLL